MTKYERVMHLTDKLSTLKAEFNSEAKKLEEEIRSLLDGRKNGDRYAVKRTMTNYDKKHGAPLADLVRMVMQEKPTEVWPASTLYQEIDKRFGTKPSSSSSTVSKLIKEGYVEVTGYTGKMQKVKLTEKGRKA